VANSAAVSADFNFRTCRCRGERYFNCTCAGWYPSEATQRLDWYKCADYTVWCSLVSLKLGRRYDRNGVYILWLPGTSEPIRDEPVLGGEPNRVTAVPRVIRVGSGNIAHRLASYRVFFGLNERYNYKLLVTWTFANCLYACRGIERYLQENLDPLNCERFPDDAPPIPVELPPGWKNFRPPFSKKF
jgi:hypothetical protein